MLKRKLAYKSAMLIISQTRIPQRIYIYAHIPMRAHTEAPTLTRV